MRWRGRRQSENIEDRRRMRPSRRAAAGGGGAILLVLIVMLLGGDPTKLLQQLQGNAGQPPGAAPAGAPGGLPAENAAQDELSQFVSVVLADTEDVWHQLFAQTGRTYREPKLVLFHGQVESACGFASAAVGPFYCPADQHLYIDLSFFEDLKRRHHAPGDFAQAYVIAHEIGHHVQKLLGTSDQVDAMRRQLSKEEFNRLSVRLELQADFYAGVWAHHAHRTKQILERGDIEEALRAASAIGDDRLQKEAQGYVVPESFTHGTSEQRARWFRKGLTTGDMSQGDTFAARTL